MAIVTHSWGFDVLVFSFSLSAAFYWFMTKNFNYWAKRNVFQLKPVPFLGDFGDCILQRKCVGDAIRDLYEKSKGHKLFGFYVYHKPFLMIRDPELIKQVLIKDFEYFRNHHGRPGSSDKLGNANLFLVPNPAWKYLRSKLSPIYTSGKLRKLFELMLDVAADLDTYMESLHLEGEGKDIDLKDVTGKFTTDLIGTTGYGLKVNSLKDPDAEFRKAGEHFARISTWRGFEMVSMFFLPEIGNLMGFQFFPEKTAKFLDEAFWGTINERIKSGIKRHDLIDLMIELRKKQQETGDYGEFKFDGDNLVAQPAIFFTAGFETSSGLTSFVLFELAKHPEMQVKLRMEIHETLEKCNNQLTYDIVASMPYLEMITAEALRKYPTLPFLDRETMADYKFPNSDLIIKKGTPIIIPMSGLHHDPEYFPDPEEFIPERFQDNRSLIKSYTYIPFGDGPHACIGLRLGLAQAKLGLIHILSNYEVRPCINTPAKLKFESRAFFLFPERNKLYLNVRKINR